MAMDNKPPLSRRPVICGAAIAPAAGSTYTVQKGDTLYGIAKAHYGDGKQWTKIVAANPGLDAAHLSVGRKIVLP